MNKLILIRGLPGSGKSTFAKHIAKNELQWADGHEKMVICEADGFHMIPDRGDIKYHFDKTYLTYAHNWCQSKAAKLLRDGVSAIVSNTSLTLKSLAPYALMACDFHVDLEIYRMCDEFKTEHGVPDEVMANMRLNFIDVRGERMVHFVDSLAGYYVGVAGGGEMSQQIFDMLQDAENETP